MIPSVAHVDLQRVKDCLQGKVTHRQCGKTVARVMLMISAGINAIYTAKPSAFVNFLFVGENQRHLKDIQAMAHTFLTDLNFDIISHSYASGFIKTYASGRYISFFFYSPENVMCKVRGTTFDKTIVDLTYDTYAKHARELFEVKHIYTRQK